MAEMNICGWPCRINILSQFDLLLLRVLRFFGGLGSFFGLRRFWFGLCEFCADELEVMRLSVAGPWVGLWVVLGRGGARGRLGAALGVGDCVSAPHFRAWGGLAWAHI